jgi:hypothetical protein
MDIPEYEQLGGLTFDFTLSANRKATSWNYKKKTELHNLRFAFLLAEITPVLSVNTTV